MKENVAARHWGQSLFNAPHPIQSVPRVKLIINSDEVAEPQAPESQSGHDAQ